MSGTTQASGEAYREATREISGITATAEKRALAWLVRRLPAWVTPDHLTLLGMAAMAAGGLAYAASGHYPGLLLVVNAALALNWFGDSLDGTLARHRRRLRPRYGFYVDHVVDAFGALFLLGGLGVSGLVTPGVAAALLLAYYLFSINMYLATHTLGRFKLSYGAVGGTELRLALAAVNLLVMAQPSLRLGGVEVLVFDVLGTGAAGGLLVVLGRSVYQVTRELYDLERLDDLATDRPAGERAA